MVKEKKNKINIQGWLQFLVAVAFVWLIIGKWDEVNKIGQTVWQANWNMLWLAVIVQFLIMWNQAAYYRQCYQLFQMKINTSRFFWVLSVSNFLSIVTPSGGFVAGGAIILDDGRKLGFKMSKMVLANIVYWVSYYSVFLVFLVLGLFFLLIKNQLTDYIWLPAMILFVMVVLFLLLLMVVMDDYDHFKKNVVKWAIVINKFNRRIGRAGIDLKIVKSYSFEIFEGYSFVFKNWYKLRGLLLRASMMFVLNTMILMLLTYSCGGAWWNVGVLMATYVIAGLLMAISVTPSGAGVVELAMSSLLNVFILPLDKALTVVVLFRFCQFWLPIVWGFVVYRMRESYNRF